MKIAILGWGSLIWDSHPAFDDQLDEWLSGGPELSLEFSRVSTSRLGALTLVIDEASGAPCKVSYALSKRNNPDDAICDLRCRERTNLRRIGYYFADGSRFGEPNIPDSIKAWAGDTKLDVVIWTGLPSNFNEDGRGAFSVRTALTYLQRLPPDKKTKAVEYIWRAPDFIQTPLRSVLEMEPWFNPPTP